MPIAFCKRTRSVNRSAQLAACLLGLSALSSAAAAVNAVDAAEGWLALFDGSSRFGWTTEAGNWQSSGDVLASDGTAESRIRTDAAFGDFDLKFEARFTGVPATLTFRNDPQSKPAQPGYAMSLADATISGGAAPNAACATPSWNHYEVRAEGTHLVTLCNGQSVTDTTNAKNRIGSIQFTAPRSTHLELRSILLKPLDLDDSYNHANLDGWKSVAAPAPQKSSGFKIPIPGLSGKPKPPKPAVWSGSPAMHGEGGEGQLETARVYDDFILQFRAKTSAAEHDGEPAASLFFRSEPGKFKSGYTLDLDDTKNAQGGKSFGTGGLIALQKARAVAVPAGQSFTGTVIARGHRFSVWINGVEVTDFYDSRPEGAFHSAAGPLGFRLGSEHAALDLQSVTVAVLPKGPEAPPPAPLASTPSASGAAAGAPGATAMPVMPVMPGESPEEKAQKAQVRQLTVDALSTSTPEDAVRINKQILVLDPSDMPAQQRLDKAQAQVDAANLIHEHTQQTQQASTAKNSATLARRDALLHQTQDDLLRGDPNQAHDHLNDAERLGAAGPEVDRLQSIVGQRLRNRLLLRLGLGGGSLFALLAAAIYFWRRRRMSLIALLVALDGPDKGKRFLLNQEVTHIGAVAMDGGKKNEVLVRDPDRQVSRFHCEVHKRGNLCFLIDLDSSNGTFLRNRRIEPGVAMKLRNGDRITLARSASFDLHLEKHRTR